MFRKSLFAVTGMTSVAAVCYPQEAVDLTRQGWIRLKTEVLGVFKPNRMYSVCLKIP